jgi:putative transposase
MTQRHPIQHDRISLITTVTKGRFPFFANAALAREAIERLYRTQQLHPFFLYGFVIMPDHCHFLMKVCEPMSISNVIRHYKSGLKFDVGIPKLWQQRFHMRLPDNPLDSLRYIHRNPVVSGFVDLPEEYPWSSASGKWDVSPLDMV